MKFHIWYQAKDFINNQLWDIVKKSINNNELVSTIVIERIIDEIKEIFPILDSYKGLIKIEFDTKSKSYKVIDE